MRMKIAALIINGILYSLIIAGLCMTFSRSFQKLFQAMRLRRGLSGRSRKKKKKDALELHMDRLTEVCLGGVISGSAFLYLSCLLFIVVTAVGMRSLSLLSGMLIGLGVAAMPYMILRIRLESIRKKTSYEGEIFVGNLLASYRICGCNIYEAMEKMADEREKSKNSVRLLLRLLYEFRMMTSEEEALRAAESFSYGINTNWGRMLAYDLRMAAVRGMDISVALEDLLIQLREARVAAEERKRLNGESMRMVIFMVPISYIFTVFISMRYLGMDFREFCANQFFTRNGFMMFLLVIVLFFVNLVVLEIVNNKRFDY